MAQTSIYPTDARLLNAITQEYGLNRNGLIADCLLPKVKVPSCNFKYIDWSKSAVNESRLDNLRVEDFTATCSSLPKEIDPSTFEYTFGEVKLKSARINLLDCCVDFCDTPPFDLKAIKAEELTDRLLIEREFMTVAAVLDVPSYANVIGDITVNYDADMGYIDLAAATGGSQFSDPTFDVYEFFQTIQSNVTLASGSGRNVAVMTKKALMALMRHPSLVQQNCCGPTFEATVQQIAALLGLEKICLADAYYNGAASGAFALQRFWNDGDVLLASAHSLRTAEQGRMTFGFTAYTRDLAGRTHIDMDTVEPTEWYTLVHDYTPVIADFRHATLIQNALV